MCGIKETRRNCKTCGKSKPIEDFPRAGRYTRVTGETFYNFRGHCRACHNPRKAAHERKLRKKPEYRERVNARFREWRRERRKDREYREEVNAKNRVENMTPAQHEKRKARRRVENMTPAQHEKKKARERVENMTPAQRKKVAAAKLRNYHRRMENPEYRKKQAAYARARRASPRRQLAENKSV